MGTSGTVNNMFLSGLLGGVGNQMMTHEERQYQQKLQELKLKREVLASLASDKTASPQAQALALQGLLSSPDQPKAKGIRGKLGQKSGTSPLDDILSQIKAMPAQTQPAKPPIQMPAIPAAPPAGAAPQGRPMSEMPPIQVPGMPGSPPLTPPKLGMMGAPPQMPQQLPGMPEIPGLKADPSQIFDPRLAQIRLDWQLQGEADKQRVAALIEGGESPKSAAEMVYGKYQQPHFTAMKAVTGTFNGQPAVANFHPDTGKYTDPSTGEELDGFMPNPSGQGSPNDYKTFYAAGKAMGKSDAQLSKDWADRQVSIANRKIPPGQVISTTNPETGQAEVSFISGAQRKGSAAPTPKVMTDAGGQAIRPKLAAQDNTRIKVADTIQNQGDRAIAFIQAHRDIFGPKAGRWNNIEQMIGSQDPVVAAAGSMLKSFALFQPALHIARGKAMSDEFIGDVAQMKTNPDALIAKIREYQAAAKNAKSAILQGRDPDAMSSMPAPPGVPSGYVHVKHSDGRTGWASPDAAKKNNWQVVP